MKITTAIFTCLSIDKHLCNFQNEAMMNKAAMKQSCVALCVVYAIISPGHLPTS